MRRVSQTVARGRQYLSFDLKSILARRYFTPTPSHTVVEPFYIERDSRPVLRAAVQVGAFAI